MKPLESPADNRKLNVITQLRGLAALGVFLYHMVCLSNNYIGNATLNHILFYGKYGVQFFFVISGFVITYSLIKADYQISNFPTFFIKRVIRIEPPYLVVLLLTVLFLLVREQTGLAHGETQAISWQQVLLHIGYLIPFSSYSWLSVVFYTLAIEFQFYLIFSLSFTVFATNKWGRWSISLLLAVMFFCSTSDHHFFYWSPIFLLGIYLALYKKRKIKSTEYLVATAVLLGMILYKLDYVTLISCIIPVIAIYFEPVIRSYLLDFLGNISYSLYLLHPLTAMTIMNIGRRTATTFPQKLLMVAFATALTIVCSYLLNKYVEKPFQKLASGIRYKS